MTREQALIVGKLAYADISKAIEKWEKTGDNGEFVRCHWDECISVDEFLFYGHELRE